MRRLGGKEPATRKTAFEILWLSSTGWRKRTFPLFSIGEQANRVSAGLVAKNPDIPWSQIAGPRHRLVRNYEGAN